ANVTRVSPDCVKRLRPRTRYDTANRPTGSCRRHSLGAVLMQERRFAEAEQVYRDDLARLPENGWSLFGLAQSLHRQGKEEEAATEARFQKIWSKADVQIKSSCLCQPGV